MLVTLRMDFFIVVTSQEFGYRADGNPGNREEESLSRQHSHNHVNRMQYEFARVELSLVPTGLGGLLSLSVFG